MCIRDRAEDGPETEDVAKGGAESFGDKFSEVKNRKICDEVWDICYALQSSICSILNDEELDSTQAVSYTHLDVYKRQAPEGVSCAGARATNHSSL